MATKNDTKHDTPCYGCWCCCCCCCCLRYLLPVFVVHLQCRHTFICQSPCPSPSLSPSPFSVSRSISVTSSLSPSCVRFLPPCRHITIILLILFVSSFYYVVFVGGGPYLPFLVPVIHIDILMCCFTG